MTGSFFGLQIGKHGIFTQRKAIEVTSHNIANVNTPGYTRQRAVINNYRPHTMTSLNTPVTPQQVGTGSFVSHIQQFRDAFIDTKITNELSNREWKKTADDLMKQVETIINEPGLTTIRDQLDKYWAAWQDLSNDASNTALRANLVEETNNLVKHFQEVDNQLRRLQGSPTWFSQGSIENQVDDTVKQINNLANQIGNLNEQIGRSETDATVANDLRDMRQRALEELAELIDIDAYYNKSDQLTINTGSHTLVQHNVVKELSLVVKNGESTTSVFPSNDYPEFSDNPSVATATLDHTADQRNITLTVSQIAKEHEQYSFLTFHPLTGPLSDFGVSSGNFYVNGREFYVDAENTTMKDLASQLDNANINLRAVINESGQLELKSTQTGTEYSIETSNGTSNLMTVLNLQDNQLAQDARFNYGGREFVSSSNKVSDALNGVNLYLKDVGVANLDLRPIVTGGKLKGLLEVRDGVIDDVLDNLNKLAYTIITETNQLHRNGFGLDGETNRNFFKPIIAENPDNPYEKVIQNMSMEELIVSNYETIAAAGGTYEKDSDRLRTYNGDGDGSIAIQIAQLKHENFFNNGKSNFNDYYNEIVTEMAAVSQRYERESSYSANLVEQLQAKRDEVAGVSMDEELANLIKFQHAYNAAARVISVADEMLERVVNGFR